MSEKMKRPKREDFLNDENYACALNRYCDELETEIKDLKLLAETQCDEIAELNEVNI